MDFASEAVTKQKIAVLEKLVVDTKVIIDDTLKSMTTENIEFVLLGMSILGKELADKEGNKRFELLQLTCASWFLQEALLTRYKKQPEATT